MNKSVPNFRRSAISRRSHIALNRKNERRDIPVITDATAN
jgi:hypothetical protein